MEQQVNTFTGGMNQDLAKTSIPANMYYQAVNFRPTTDKGLTNGALENIRGNLDLLDIPDAFEVTRFTLDTTINGALDVEISDGIFIDMGLAPFNVTSTSTTEDLYNYFHTDAGYSNIGINYNIYYNDSYLVFVRFNTNAYSITPLNFAAAALILDQHVPFQSGLEVIGSTFINNDIYLITTNSNAKEPGVTVDTYGQVWKLVINDVDNTASIALIYNNRLQLSTYHAIAPTAILGRYENSSIQRIYWTDNWNKLRSLNVVDPQLFALDLSLVDVQPSIDFDTPIMTDIRSAPGTAVLPIGCYQLAYKLSNTGGASTIYSLPSNPIFVVTGGTGGPEENQTAGQFWIEYHGDIRGQTTTKRITWSIDNLDRDFERIEAVLLVREGKNDIPNIYSIYEGPITGDSVDIVVDGDVIDSTNTTTLSLSDFLALSAAFTHCKTIETKDNRLVVGNVRNQMTDLDFDARAFRFWDTTAHANQVDVIDTKGNAPTSYIITGISDYSNIPANSDAIAPYNLETTDPNYNIDIKYKADGITLGGEGSYISYEFVSIAVACDKTVEPIAVQPLPIVSTNPDYTTTSYNLGVNSTTTSGANALQVYPLSFPSAINDGMKFPQMNSIFWGYQNNEIYRVGIQFYDKSRNPYFVKWIGDIKFPDYNDPCPPANLIFADGTRVDTIDPSIADYRKSFTIATGAHGSNEAYVCQLGLKVSVTVPSNITDKVSGYSIVRVKREEADKRIIAEGIISNTWDEKVANNYFLPVGNMHYSGGTLVENRVSFLTPNILDASLTAPSTGMQLILGAILKPANALKQVDIYYPGAVTSTDKNHIYKLYDFDSYTSFTANIDYAALLAVNSVTHETANTYYNYGVPAQPEACNGNPNYLLLLNGSGISGLAPTYKYLGYVYNAVVNQYGGDRYTDRANNEYIMCSHFRPFKTSTIVADTSYIFGGDVTNDIMDEERISVDFNQWVPFPGSDWHNSTTFFFPASSPVNRRLRHGRTPDGDLRDVVNLNNERTDYFYNSVFSCQNDIVKFYPKPDPFVNNEEYINRFYISEIKINGELSDSWSIFKALNYWDVEGSYGPINACIALQNEVYFVQDKAFGKLLINPKTAITSTTGEEIQLGRGNVIDSHNYVSVEIGTTHQFSVIRSGIYIYFIDFRHKKIFAFSQNKPLNPETDLKGIHSWMINNVYGNLEVIDKPVYDDISIGRNGVHGVFDYLNDEVIYTFSRGENVGTEQSLTTPYTLVYSEKLGTFTANYTHYPKNYITNNKKIISANPGDLQSLYLHNYGNYGQFYGLYYPSSIEFYTNKYPQFTKVFDNLVFQTEVQDGITLIDTASGLAPVQETFNQLDVSTDYQSNSIILDPLTNLIRKFRTWRCEVPRHSVSAAYVSAGLFARMKDKYMKIKLSYTNNNNKRLILHDVISYFRPHKPG